MADYEALLDEHFQMLCQALLVREFPGVQCMPVGMPDGGRDAVVPDLRGRNALIFQVKFARRPATVRDVFTWITNAIQREIDKIARLRERGATHYVVITNIGGTSHLDVGTIDRVQAYLDRELPVPARCWWRDDLDRRLDCNFDLKLRYPHLLTGPDIVRLLWESTTGGEHHARRRDALTAYIRDQYKQDSTVRFKQVELDSTELFDLFIDVPAEPTRIHKHDRFQDTYLPAWARIQRIEGRIRRKAQHQIEDNSDDDYEYYAHVAAGYVRVPAYARRPRAVGAAALLLDPDFASAAPRIVLEGAPGQGKSTLVQYLAQIQRWRILYPNSAAGKIPQLYAASPLMLPLKIELRDLALWLSGYDPWAGSSNQKHNRPQTLEGALSAHIQRYSGGITFEVADLAAITNKTPILLILDALDEVADLDDRRKVVEEILAGLSRLETQGHQIRTIVTSRPTAIVNSPAFTSDQFSHLSLAPLTHSLAVAYAERWGKARRLDPRDSKELLAALRQKLQSPHMAELAKNTMQLTILLSLMHVRGVSLPDKRTELYYTYIEMFLNREAEKSNIVRDNRRLLLELHGYIGYYMHARAESDKSTGRILAEELRQAIRDYLRKEEQPEGLLESLFIGVVERFVALVSRVEGTYEFEVQPLREYFAARFLYDTAPYSPAGREKAGAKPDRFDGIASNPYWLNVTRFFAGCFSKGELADLADRACELIGTKELQITPYPRMLATSLLQDWALAQSTKATRQVVRSIFDELGIRWATCSDESPGLFGAGISRLPTGSGGEYLAELLYDRLKSEGSTERASGIALLLSLNAPHKWIKPHWCSELAARSGQAVTEWLIIGSWLNMLRDVTNDELTTALGRDERTDSDLAVCGRGGQPVMDGDENLRHRAVRAVLREACLPQIGLTQDPSVTSTFATLVHPYNWIMALHEPGFPNYYFATNVRTYQLSGESLESPTINAINHIIKLVPELWRKDVRHDLTPWTAVTTELVTRFGKNWTAAELGVIAGGIKSSSARGAGANRLFMDSFSLPERIRYARRHASDLGWWSAQIDALEDVHDNCLWLMAALIWARFDVVATLLPQIDQHTADLEDLERCNLIAASTRAAQYAKHSESERTIALEELAKLGSATLAALLPRFADETRRLAVHERLLHEMDCPQIATACLRVIVEEFRSGDLDDRTAIDLAMSCHEAGGLSTGLGSVIPKSRKAAKKWLNIVLAEPWMLPNAFLMRTSRIGASFMAKPVPVMRIAESHSWFSE